MSRKSRKDSFNNGSYNHFSEVEDHKDLVEIFEIFESRDFSKQSNKEEVFNRTLKNINKHKGENTVKKSNKFKHPITKIASFALVGILSISLMQTSFAQDVVGKVLKTISLGHIVVFEDEFPEIESYSVPDKLKGRIFDKDGNPIKEFSKTNPGNVYTADGEQISDVNFKTGEIITVAESEELMKEQTLIVKDPNELNNYTCFDVILPSYLPEGYKFEKAEFYKDEDGIVENSKYISLYFSNEKIGKFIYMQQRFADEETGYATGGSKVEEIKINGVDAIFYSDKNIDWEANGVIYGLSGRGEISKNELIKIAESIK